MKKLFLFLILLAGCAQLPPQEVSVRFGLSFYESGQFPTKGFSEEIAATIPSAVGLVLTNTSTNVEYNVATGESITLPVGTYTVTGQHVPTATQLCYGTTKYLCKTPGITVEDEVTVEAGTANYSVAATYTGFAVGVLPSECSAWKVKIKTGSFEDVDRIEAEGLWWVFGYGSFSSTQPLDMTLVPISGSNFTHRLVMSNPDENMTLVENGKWYILHPTMTTTQAGTFGLSLPPWVSGQ